MYFIKFKTIQTLYILIYIPDTSLETHLFHSSTRNWSVSPYYYFYCHLNRTKYEIVKLNKRKRRKNTTIHILVLDDFQILLQ
ncbi:hypothetical protein ES703_10445 [subsurface metagenome]